MKFCIFRSLEVASSSPTAWARPRGHLTMVFLGISSSGLGSSLGQRNNWQKETPMVGFTAGSASQHSRSKELLWQNF